MPMLPLLGLDHCLPLLHMSTFFICINETKKPINGFAIENRINPGLNVKTSFIYQVGKCMHTTFGEITQPFIKSTLSQNNTSVLALTIFYKTISDNPKKDFRVLSCVIYTMIKNYVCIDCIACPFKK